MSKGKLITGINIKDQMTKAKKILLSEVLPKEKLFQQRKKAGKLSQTLLCALKVNA